MNILTILDEYTEALVEDISVELWCKENYSRAQKVYQGIDPRDEPTEDDVPATNIILLSKKTGDSLLTYDYGLAIMCTIYDETKTTATTGDTILTKYTGVRNIEEYRKLVETCIVNVDTGANGNVTGLRIDELEIDYEMIEFFPYFKADMVFGFVNDRYLGDDTFA